MRSYYKNVEGAYRNNTYLIFNNLIFNTNALMRHL